MTYPGQGDQSGQPWQQPEQQWQQRPEQQWQPGYPQTGPQPQQQWQQPQGYPQTSQFPYGQQQPYAQGVPPQPPRKSKRGLIIGLVVALVALVGGGVTWLALSLGGKSGAASPGEAADTLMTSVQEGDLVGAMDSLAPAEAALMSDMISDYVEELKRIEILDSSADPSNVTGLELQSTEDLVWDDSKAKKINDHLTMAALTDGTLQLTGKFSEIPLAQSFKDAVIPPEMQAEMEAQSPNETLDIGAMVQQTGQPIYIATVKVDDEWYPSLFHTIAHYALEDEREQWPSTSTPAVGADSPNAAIKALVEAVRTTDIQKVIEIMPPDEMAVLHDLGPMLIEKVNAEPESQQDMPFELVTLETEESDVSGGTRSTLSKLEVRITDGSGPGTIAVQKSGDCYDVQVDSEMKQFCAAELSEQLQAELGGAPPEVVSMVSKIMGKLMDQGVGVVTTEVDGKHYVSPMRTYSELIMTILRSVDAEDIQTLINSIKGG
jgi:hypothetical protein